MSDKRDINLKMTDIRPYLNQIELPFHNKTTTHNGARTAPHCDRPTMPASLHEDEGPAPRTALGPPTRNT